MVFQIQDFCCGQSTVQFKCPPHHIFPFDKKGCTFNPKALSHLSIEGQYGSFVKSFKISVFYQRRLHFTAQVMTILLRILTNHHWC